MTEVTESNQKAEGAAAPKRQPVSFQDQEIKKILVKDEEVLLRAELHSAIYWKSFAVFIVALLFIFLIPPLGVLFGLVGAVMFGIALLTQHFLLLAVTNKRILARYGLLQMDVVDIRLSKVESIDLERMLPGHIFGYASVVVMGTGQRVIRVPYIANADAFRRYYNEVVLADEGSEEGEEEIKRVKEEEAAEAEKKERKKAQKV